MTNIEKLRAITEIVGCDFIQELEAYNAFDKDFVISQEDAKYMLEIISDTYKIAHTVDCKHCNKNLSNNYYAND